MRDPEVNYVRELLKKLENQIKTTRKLYGSSVVFLTPIEHTLSDLSKYLGELAKKDRKHIKSLAEGLVEDHEITTSLAHYVWYKRDLLNRGVGHLFHSLFTLIKERGMHEKYRDVLPQIALLALAAHHDIPSIERIDNKAKHLLGELIKNTNNPFFFLGRRSLKRFVDNWETIKLYYELVPSRVKKILRSLGRDTIERYGRERGGNVTWSDYMLFLLDKELEESFPLKEYEIHPEELVHLKPYLLRYLPDIKEELKRIKGKKFFEYKFGKHSHLIEEILKRLESINKKKRKYRYSVPDDTVTHMHAQIIPHACTSWSSYMLGILHSPSIPIVLKSHDWRTVGRMFITLAKDKRENRYYLVLGDYEGRKSGRQHFYKEVIPLLQEIARKHLGTEPLHYAKGGKRLVAPHTNPWVAEREKI